MDGQSQEDNLKENNILSPSINELLKNAELKTNESSYEKLPSDLVIFNLQNEFDHIKCLDEKDHIMQKEFKKFVSKYNNDNKILIHCSFGVSRSGSFTLLYLMKKFSLKYKEVIYYLK